MKIWQRYLNVLQRYNLPKWRLYFEAWQQQRDSLTMTAGDVRLHDIVQGLPIGEGTQNATSPVRDRD